MMKKLAIVLVFFLLAIKNFAQDVGSIDFIKRLANPANQLEILKSGLAATNFPFVPGFYLSLEDKTFVTFGLMINDGEKATPLRDVFQTAILLQAAIIIQRKKTNVILFFDYYDDDTWGLSLKLRF